MQALAKSEQTNAPICMYAVTATGKDTLAAIQSVGQPQEPKRNGRVEQGQQELQPRYACDFLWEENRHPTF